MTTHIDRRVADAEASIAELDTAHEALAQTHRQLLAELNRVADLMLDNRTLRRRLKRTANDINQRKRFQ